MFQVCENSGRVGVGPEGIKRLTESRETIEFWGVDESGVV